MFYTNFGITNSRSQCIINIRASCNGFSNETKLQSSDAMLTIVDLAGAEREKRTGNQVLIYLVVTLYMDSLICKTTNICHVWKYLSYKYRFSV